MRRRRREKKPGRVIDRITTCGETMLLVAGLKCLQCDAKLDDRWFAEYEPRDGLCESCTKTMTTEDYGTVATDHREPKPLRFVAAEAEPGKSTGRPRKHLGSMGSAENANGCWDNLIRELES